MQAREIMTENPACCMPLDGIWQVAQLMRDNHCGMLPVVNDFEERRLTGIITDWDIICRVVAAERDCHTAIVLEVMTTGRLWTVHPESSVDEVLDCMEAGQGRWIPVVDDNNILLGTISTADIVLEFDEPAEIAEVFGEISEPTRFPHT